MNKGYYYVLTSISDSEESYEQPLNGRLMGLFTSNFVCGCGWNADLDMGQQMTAVDNNNVVITSQAICIYTSEKNKHLINMLNLTRKTIIGLDY